MEGEKGYKVFHSDWTCRGKQYSCPGTFEEDVDLKLCKKGIHFCKKLADCFSYYTFDPKNKVAEVCAEGDVLEDGDKSCTNKLRIVRELTWYEVLDLVNSGNGNSGYRNSGNWNSGNGNSGNGNSGNGNSGYRNSGNWNSGDWNSCDYSSGCFCTESEKVRFFNKESELNFNEWRHSRARLILALMPKDKLSWVDFSEMSEVQKKEHKDAETCGDYLRLDQPDDMERQKWWESLSPEDKKEVLSLPNFDAEIFKEITGIDVHQK